MSTTQPSQFTQPDPANPRTTPLLHNASLAALIVCPIVMRKSPLDFVALKLGLELEF